MTDKMEGQLSIFDLDIWSGKMFLGPSPVTEEKTSRRSSRKSSGSQTQMPQMCLCLKKNGRSPDACTMSWADGLLLGEYTMRSFGECPKEENVSRLSQILEAYPLQRYSLSAKACAGILQRAERRGKILPPELKAALERQAGLFSTTRGGQQITVSEDGILPTPRAETHGNLPCVIQEPKTYFIQGNCIDRADNAGCNGRGWNDEVCYTLNTIDRPAVYDARGNGDGKTVCTITGDHENRVTDYTALCIGNGQMNQSVGDKAGALNCMHDPQAVFVPDVAHALKGKANCDFRADSETYPVQNSVVRRLTPLECERLQGYPDGWTDIGEWVDSKGKRHKDADSPRYKALGNSIALPFWFWLLRRISAQYIGPATLGSLFDGIGGFPLAWERCNGPGTAIFASEIEEFPIAVTKRHFPEDRIKERGREQDE